MKSLENTIRYSLQQNNVPFKGPRRLPDTKSYKWAFIRVEGRENYQHASAVLSSLNITVQVDVFKSKDEFDSILIEDQHKFLATHGIPLNPALKTLTPTNQKRKFPSKPQSIRTKPNEYLALAAIENRDALFESKLVDKTHPHVKEMFALRKAAQAGILTPSKGDE
jgi:hypothetical protein